MIFRNLFIFLIHICSLPYNILFFASLLSHRLVVRFFHHPVFCNIILLVWRQVMSARQEQPPSKRRRPRRPRRPQVSEILSPEPCILNNGELSGSYSATKRKFSVTRRSALLVCADSNAMILAIQQKLQKRARDFNVACKVSGGKKDSDWRNYAESIIADYALIQQCTTPHCEGTLRVHPMT